MPSGIKKHIREEKARIRREFLSDEKRAEQIRELYKKFISYREQSSDSNIKKQKKPKKQNSKKKASANSKKQKKKKTKNSAKKTKNKGKKSTNKKSKKKS